MSAARMPTWVSLLLALANVGFAGAGGPRVVKPGDRIEISLGLVDVGSDHGVVVPLQNGSVDVWHMPQVDVSCPACMTIVSAPEKLAPGEVGQLRLNVHAAGTPGLHRWGVSIHGGNEPPLRVDVRGTLRGLRLDPPRAAFGRQVLGDSHVIDVRASWFGEGAIESIDASSATAWVDVRVQPSRPDDSIEVSISLASALHPRSVSASVEVFATIRRRDGRAYVIRRTIPVAGQLIDPSLTVRPAAVFLGSIDPGQDAHMQVEFFGPDALHVEARSAMPGLQVSLVNEQVELHYVASEGAAGLRRGSVELGWGDPWALKAHIPVTVYVRKEYSE
ncbi:MAG: hypothetical protein HOJ54_04000 [Phycisphaerae bacterium]|nr:hypothetical protein [Phycisphaerae bacterium]